MPPLHFTLAAVLALASSAHAQLTRQPNTTLMLPDDLPAATSYVTENALGTLSFERPICTAFPPGETNRLFVAERGDQAAMVPRSGAIQAVTDLSGTPAKTAYLDLSALLAPGESLRTDLENGLLSLVFHPHFATNGTFFVYYSMQVVEGGEGRLFQRLHKVVVSDPAASTASISSHLPLLTIRDRDVNHNGGDLHFGPDGYLYLSLGDEGGAGDGRNNARFINHDLAASRTGFWGKMLRLDVDLRPENLDPNPHVQNSTTFPSAVHPGGYKVPADNPFIGYTRWNSLPINPATVRTEIYATGLRNPFRFSFDAPTGRIFLADVGQETWEEVNLIVKGGDYGWSWREAGHPFGNPRPPVTPPPPANPGDPPGTGFNPIAPIFEYDRLNAGPGDLFGSTVIGGMVIRGNRLPELFGAYICSDHYSGQILALRENGSTWTPQILGIDNAIADYGIDPRNGDLLLCDIVSNTVKRLARSGTMTGPNPPALLSGTGVFANLSTLTPHAGIVPYTPNVDFWSDYAIKSRWFSLRNLTDTIGFSADGNWTFPTGIVWIKHFDLETTRGIPATRRKLETRILVKTASDVYGLSYKWRADQSDAELVAEEGLTELIPASSPAQSWRYPGRSECRTCHTPAGGFALSFNTRQVNRDHQYGALAQNQIAALSSAGYFSAAVPGVNTLPAFPNLSDSTASLEARVRAYLAVNCSQCHQPGGNANAGWDARPTTPTDAAGLINGLLVNPFGDSANRFAVPGDLAHSMVLKRIQGAGVPRMPPLGTFERDLAAEQLLTDWITQALPARQSFADWQTAHFGSPNAPLAAPAFDPDLDGQNNALEFLQRSSPTTPGVPVLPLQPLGNFSPATIEIHFVHPANRSCVIETSTDLLNWSLWDVPGNAPQFPAADTPRVLSGPRVEPHRQFRLKLGER